MITAPDFTREMLVEVEGVSKKILPRPQEVPLVWRQIFAAELNPIQEGWSRSGGNTTCWCCLRGLKVFRWL